MKKLIVLIAVLFTINVSNAEIVRQYNGKIVDGECRFSFNKRKGIIDKELLNVVYTHTLLGTSEDDYEFKLWLKNQNTGKRETKTIRFCKLQEEK